MFKSILIPIDLAEVDVARPAINVACEIARDDSKVRFMNVASTLPSNLMEYVPADFDQMQRTESLKLLQEIGSNCGLPRERLSYCVAIGGVYLEVLAEADAWGADLIIIGSHRPNMATYLLGSNAKTIVRHAKCSVLVVRS